MAKRLSSKWFEMVISDLEVELEGIIKDKQKEVLKEKVDHNRYRSLHDEEIRIGLLITGLSHSA